MTTALWITSSYPWAAEPGAGLFYRTQARALTRRGDRLTVVSPVPWAPWPLPRLRERWARYARAPRAADDAGVGVLRPRYLNLPRQPSASGPDRRIAGAAWRERGRWAGAQLVHGHYAITGLAAWRVATRARLPFVLTFHGSDINTWPADHPDRIPDLRAAARDAALVIGVSAALAERIGDLTGVQALHLPLGSDHAAIDAARRPRQDARAALGFADEDVVVLFVGNLLPAKGIRALADAVVALGRPYLGVFVGEGPERGYGEDAGPTGNIRYEGPKTHAEVITFMSAADVLVLPSMREGLPGVLVEAGSVGLPVVASRVGGIPELLGTDRGTLLDVVTPAAIGAAISAVRTDPAAAAARAERLRAHVRDRYDADRNAALLSDHYAEIAAKAARP